MTELICVIPARMASSRFPGKPLVPLLGLALVLHVYERCRLYEGFSEVLIATCDEDIRAVAEAHGATVVMTADTHERCTDRVEEAIAVHCSDVLDDTVIVMVQGDEVLVSPEMIADVIEAQVRSGATVVNLGSKLSRTEDHDSPDTVKVVAGADGRALYFSRAPIPSRSQAGDNYMYQQTGIMAFTKGFLDQFAALKQTPLEIAESVDMLRVLEHDIPLYVVFTETETIGIDTPEDKIRGEEMLTADPFTGRYLNPA